MDACAAASRAATEAAVGWNSTRAKKLSFTLVEPISHGFALTVWTLHVCVQLDIILVPRYNCVYVLPNVWTSLNVFDHSLSH